MELTDRIMAVLRASTSASLLDSQLTAQVSGDGHGTVTGPSVKQACAELARTGQVTRSGGFGGNYRWAVAE